MKRLLTSPFKCAALCIVTAGLLFATPLTALASDRSAVDGWSDALTTSMSVYYSAYNSEGTTAAAAKTFPSELDLRDRGIVTSVKNQGLSNTCWAHAAIAASETSILSELGATYADTGLDLSERYLAIFAYSAATEAYAGADQAGEGFAADDGTSSSLPLKIGGYQTAASTLFSAGIGPVSESVAPYRSDSGLIQCDVYDKGTSQSTSGYEFPSTYYLTMDQIEAMKPEWEAKGYKYEIGSSYAIQGFGLPDPGWGLDSTLYGQSAYALEQSYLLPDVRILDAENHYAGTSSEAVAAIKEQLSTGRGVAAVVSYNDAQFYNDSTGAYYNNSDSDGSAHAVTIVGYDDTYEASNFKEGKQPEKPGAFLVKNSYGASTNSFPHHGNFGIKDAEGNSTGYFWLSYYDHTIVTPAAYDYDINPTTSANTFESDQYNFLANQTTLLRSSDEKVGSANVFKADSDRVLRALSCETAKLNTKATYEVYLLADDAKSPTDGTLALSKTVTYEYGGYHRLMLEDEGQLAMRAGQRYSVVVTLSAQIDGTEKYYQTAGKSSACLSGTIPISRFGGTFATKVNEGESYSLEADGQWSDWSVLTNALAEKQTNCCVDNPPIKAFYEQSELASAEELAALRQSIANAQAKLEAAKVSVDGSDIDPDDVWVTQESHDALAFAIAEAKATLERAGDFEVKLAGTTPDSATVNGATEALASATESFSPKAGTKTAEKEVDATPSPEQTAEQATAKSKASSPKTGDDITSPLWLALLAALSALIANTFRRVS